MKITNIYGENFKSLSSFNWDNPGKLNVILGKNGSGKTSVLELIRYILTGETPETIVKSGEKQCVAGADLLGISFRRSNGVKNNVKINGKTTTQKSFAQLVSEETGCTMDTVKLATSTNMLSAMNAGQFADYLITNKLIPAEIDMDTLLALCPMSPEAELELSMVLPGAPVMFDMKAIDDAYDYFFAARTALKNELKKKIVEAEYDGPIPTRDLAAIDAELVKCSSYDNELATYKKLNEVYENAVAQRQKILADISNVEASISKMGNLPPANPNAKTAFTARLNVLKGEEESISKTLHALTISLDMNNRSIENLRCSNSCPLCEKLECPADKGPIIKELEEICESIKAAMEDPTKQLEKVQQTIKNFEDKIKQEDELEARNKELEMLYAKRNTLKSSIPEIPEKPIPPAEITDMSAKKNELNAERANLIKHKAAEDATVEAKHLEKRVQTHDELVRLLSPKAGIRQEITRVALEPIVEHCNARAAHLKLNFTVALQADNGVRIVCNPNTSVVKEMLPLESVSAGEQAYALFLVMDALNSLHALRLLLMDDLDKLDATAFKNLLELLLRPEVQDDYDHIFMALVDHSDAQDIINANHNSIDSIISL